ncbi:hypothetical protein MMC07_001332 [Pseudocyphellaria aurata]|nr:hypothetical protein [Pseudocyphellaria aurata]
MARWISRHSILGFLASFGLILFFTFCLSAWRHSPLSSNQLKSPDTPDQVQRVPPAHSKHAFALLVGRDFQDNSGPDEQDTYFTAARVLIYQLLHAPQTHTNTSLDVVVLATTDVRASKLARLASDGARVLVVDPVTSPWIKSNEPRWADVLTKLRVWTLTEYEKVLFLDSDMLLVDRMDGIFADATTEPQRPIFTRADSSEPALPATYMLAAQTIQNQRVHPYPPDGGDYFSSGFFLCQPSRALYEYYLSLTADDEASPGSSPTKKKKKFDPFLPEQNLLNYAHRRDGPMPWRDVHYTWTTTWPSWREVARGAKSLHEKWWCDDLPQLQDERDQELRRWWWRVRWEMDGFYSARDAVRDR